MAIMGHATTTWTTPIFDLKHRTWKMNDSTFSHTGHKSNFIMIVEITKFSTHHSKKRPTQQRELPQHWSPRDQLSRNQNQPTAKQPNSANQQNMSSITWPSASATRKLNELMMPRLDQHKAPSASSLALASSCLAYGIEAQSSWWSPLPWGTCFSSSDFWRHSQVCNKRTHHTHKLSRRFHPLVFRTHWVSNSLNGPIDSS